MSYRELGIVLEAGLTLDLPVMPRRRVNSVLNGIFGGSTVDFNEWWAGQRRREKVILNK
jgi:hypothetical protein